MNPLPSTIIALALAAPAAAQCEQGPLEPHTDGLYLGVSAALDGDTLAVGMWDATYEDFAGAVYVYVNQAGEWVEQAVLYPLDPHMNAQFGNALALDGDTLLVGAENDNFNHSDSGAAYVFVRNGTTWTQQQRIDPSDQGDHFGHSVALAGDMAVVGAPGDEDYGSLHTFVRSNGVWLPRALLTPHDSWAGNGFGSALGLDGTRLLVGADLGSTPGVWESGAVYFYDWVAGIWLLDEKVFAEDPINGTHFGFTASLDGDTALIGAEGNHIGAAYVFERGDNGWEQQAKLEALTLYEWYAEALAVSGDTAVVGAWAEDGLGSASGVVYVYDRVGSQWSLTAQLRPHDGTGGDRFGQATALQGDTLAVGAPGAGEDIQGAAYVYDLVGGGLSNYCIAAPNSSGPGAFMACHGSTSIADNDFWLHSSGSTPNNFGRYFYGPGQQQLPFGNGFLCVDPGATGLFRLNPPIAADGTGYIERRVDFSAPPAGGGDGAIEAGSTWYFQLWYRDPAAGTGFNLSDGLSVTFCP